MFDLSDEQHMLQDTLARFLAETSDNIWSGLTDLGVFGALFTEEDGGYSGNGTDIAVVFEQLGRAASTAPLIDCALLPGSLLAAAGKDLAPLLSGATRYAFAHTELNARYDVKNVQTTFNDGVINGEKSLVVGIQEADCLIVSARNGSDVGVFIVAADAPGISANGYELTQGGSAAELLLSSVPAEPLLTSAMPAIEHAWALALVAQSADTLGAMEQASAMTLDYLKTREQFGRPLGSFQALAHRVTDMMIDMEQARSAVALAATHLQESAHQRDRYGSACKNLIGRMGRRVAEECVQLHGGIGMTDEYALGRYVKRIIMSDHRFGDTDYHMERFITLNNPEA